ncbi:MAG: GyrI-like domain-containing protein [Patescibacteria group bacterium]|nr:GyrI-like domain-containing protein [Patescibacteria group bacterium]
MSKVDFKKKYKKLYSPPKGKFIIIDVPKLKFLMIDGQGDPNTSVEYQSAVEALYKISYSIKMSPKKNLKIKGFYDYTVPPLEGLWYVDDISKFKDTPKDKWKWTMMIMQPEFVSRQVLGEILGQLANDKKINNPKINKVRLEEYKEGRSVQTLYLGAYKDEGLTIGKMHKFIIDQGYKLSGKHHEIYLSDPRKVVPDKLKTIIRQPIEK